MISVFYDRKNKREVTDKELCFINYVTELGVVDSSNKNPLKVLASHDQKLGELGYKSKNCPEYANWDLTCMYTDLVFLEFRER